MRLKAITGPNAVVISVISHLWLEGHVPFVSLTHYGRYATATCILDCKSSLEPIFSVMLVVLLSQILMGESNQSLSLMARLRIYISSYWNRLDFLCLLLILVGAPLSNMPSRNDYVGPLIDLLDITVTTLNEIGRALLIISLLLYFVRLLYAFCIHKTFGPKIVMMGRMVQFCSFS